MLTVSKNNKESAAEPGRAPYIYGLTSISGLANVYLVIVWLYLRSRAIYHQLYETFRPDPPSDRSSFKRKYCDGVEA